MDRAVAPDLDAIEWLADLGPIGVGRRSLLVRTNHPATAAVLGPALAGLRPTGHRCRASPAPVTLSLVDLGRDEPPRFRVYLDGRRRWSDDDDALLVPTALDELTEMAIDGRPGRCCCTPAPSSVTAGSWSWPATAVGARAR